MQIISISGVDGSGKSTQIKLLVDHFRNHKKRVYYFHAIEFSLANRIARLKKYCLFCRLTGRCKVNDNSNQKSVVKAASFQIALRKIFLRIDIWRFQKLLKKLEKQSYDYILSDRYFLDSIVNIEYLSHQNFDFSLPDNIKPNRSFYLSVLPEKIMERERTPDQGLEYLIDKQNIFEKKSVVWNMIFVDGNGSVDEVFQNILSRI